MKVRGVGVISAKSEPEKIQKYTMSKNPCFLPVSMKQHRIADHPHTPMGRASDGPGLSQGAPASRQ